MSSVEEFNKCYSGKKIIFFSFNFVEMSAYYIFVSACLKRIIMALNIRAFKALDLCL